jgi:DNA-3-methyladenine glycosylase II
LVPLQLDHEILARAAGELAGRDPVLGQIVSEFGVPPLWAREPGFPTLLHIILEQQVSLASARAAFDRVRAAANPLTPERFLEFDDASLKAFGFSRQKTGYGRGLAQAILAGQLDLAGLAQVDDESVIAELCRLKGIGPWSAHIYLLMALGRPDVWPSGDRALAVGVQSVMGLPACPSPNELAAIGAAWMPWRSVAARIFWHYYLSTPRR